MPAITRSATVQWTGDIATGSGSLTTESGALEDAALSFPKRTAQADRETSPEELIAGAHAGCFAMSFAATVGRAGLTAAALEVGTEVGLERVGGKWHITGSRVLVVARIDGIDQAALDDLLRRADETCPVSAMIRGTGDVVLDGKLAT